MDRKIGISYYFRADSTVYRETHENFSADNSISSS